MEPRAFRDKDKVVERDALAHCRARQKPPVLAHGDEGVLVGRGVPAEICFSQCDCANVM